MIDQPLFTSEAVTVAPKDTAYWYVSGLLGPYYCNSELLCGGRESAIEVLDIIDTYGKIRDKLPQILVPKLIQIYDESEIYRGVVDELVTIIRNIPDLNAI